MIYKNTPNPIFVSQLQRLINALHKDNTDNFDFFENDIFMYFDPLDDQEDEIDEEDEIDDNIIEEESDGELISFIPTGSTDTLDILEETSEPEDDEMDDTDEDIVDPNDLLEFQNSVSFTPKYLPDFNPFEFDVPNEFEDEPPNFHHKPSNLKLWWNIDEEWIYSNNVLTFKAFEKFVNQCIASLGRRTKTFFIRYYHLGDDGNSNM